MKSKSINNLFYTGIVTLSQCTGNKKVPVVRLHNTGGNLLFDFLANCLTGDFEQAMINQPNKIMLLSVNDTALTGSEFSGTATDIEPVSDFIYLLTKPERVGTENSCTVRYSFSIASEYLMRKNFNCIGLYTDKVTAKNEGNSYLNNFVALCLIGTDELDAIPSSSRLVIDWELNISNNTDKNAEAEIYV